MPLVVRFGEARSTRNREYEQTVKNLLRTADGWEQKALESAQGVLTDLQRRIAGQLLDMVGDDPRRVRLEALQDSLSETFDRLTTELQGNLESVYRQALAEYTADYTGWYRSIGLSGALTAPALSTDLAVVAANLTTEQIVAIGPQTVKAITGQIRRAAMGGQNPMDAIRALASGNMGSDFQAIGPFRTLRQRAETDVRTELHRMFNVADESQHQHLDREAPGTLFYWYQFSTRNPRETHAAVAAETQANPIGIDEDFNVAGYKASYPHDPRLPAKEAANCNCKKFPDFRNVDLETIARRSALEAGEQQTVERIQVKAQGATGAQAPAVKSKRKTKATTRAPSWRPAMNAAQADAWAAGSTEPGFLYHATGSAADADSIRRHGFRLDRPPRWGRLFGDGVYMTDADTVGAWRGVGQAAIDDPTLVNPMQGEVLRLRVKARKTLNMGTTPSKDYTYHNVPDAIVQDTTRRYDQIRDALDDAEFTYRDRLDAAGWPRSRIRALASRTGGKGEEWQSWVAFHRKVQREVAAEALREIGVDPDHWHAMGHPLSMTASYDDARSYAFTQAVRAAGYDSLKINHGSGFQFVILDPKKVVVVE